MVDVVFLNETSGLRDHEQRLESLAPDIVRKNVVGEKDFVFRSRTVESKGPDSGLAENIVGDRHI